MHALILTEPPSGDAPGSPFHLKLCGQTLIERHVRILRRCGAQTVSVVVHDQRQIDVLPPPTGTDAVHYLSFAQLPDWLGKHDADTPIMVMMANYVLERALVRTLADRTRGILVDSASPPGAGTAVPVNARLKFAGCLVSRPPALRESLHMAGADTVRALAADGQHDYLDIAQLPLLNPELRRERRHFWAFVSRQDEVPAVKRSLIDGAQKGSLDLPAQWIHAPMENFLVSRLAETRITPNQVTLLTNIAAWCVTALMLSGHLAWGIVGAAAVGVLDGIDGKLARLKIMTSKIGELEHLFDLLFEYSWWLAIGWTLAGGHANAPVFTAALVMIACNLGETLAGVWFYLARGRHIGRTLDNVQRFDFYFRKISGRRNIYIWIMLPFALSGHLETGFYTAVAWALITLIIRGARAIRFVATPLDRLVPGTYPIH